MFSDFRCGLGPDLAAIRRYAWPHDFLVAAATGSIQSGQRCFLAYFIIFPNVPHGDFQILFSTFSHFAYPSFFCLVFIGKFTAAAMKLDLPKLTLRVGVGLVIFENHHAVH